MTKFHPILFSFLFLAASATATAPFRGGPPRLGMYGPRYTSRQLAVAGAQVTQAADGEGDFQSFFYNQTLDHFTYRPESYVTFRQRYVVSSKHWGGPGAPIFVHLGAESPLPLDFSAKKGFLIDIAPQFDSLLVYIEHRYYGQSIPFGSREEAFRNASTLGYFNSQQAISDYAEIVIHVKEQFNAGDSPVIVFGGSYGGMLATWFRLKYPHIALGALASSAPILYFDDITPQDGYYNVVTRDFREASETCYQTIKISWSEIDETVAKPDGLSILSRKFNTCSPLKDVTSLKYYLVSMYAHSAQYNTPPNYPVNEICHAIDGASGNDTLDKILAGVVAYEEGSSKTCDITSSVSELAQPSETSETDVGWAWQRCSEMVMPIGFGNETMFYSTSPFNLTHFTDRCKSFYGVAPRPHWITTHYGGHSIKRVLQRFGSNIIFSNGLKDPYSSGGVLENISDTIHAVTTVNGSHCLDSYPSDNTTDPEWLIAQRETEINILRGWLLTYSKDLNITSTQGKNI